MRTEPRPVRPDASDADATEDARTRLVRLAATAGTASRLPAAEPAPAAGGWVPRWPATSGRPEPDGHDVADGPGLRERAMAAAVTGYTAAHGHPLDHPGTGGVDETRGARRWAVRPLTVVVAVVVLLAVVGLVVARALAPVPSTVLGPGGPAAPPSEASADAPGTADGAAAAADDAHPTDAASVPSPSEPAVAADVVVVHVAGQVAQPGVLSLPAGSRVADALTAAGGPTPAADLTALNLARELVDGEQVLVPEPGDVLAAPPRPGGGAGGAATAGAGTVLDLNTADLPALDGLPGIGPVLAERIVAWRAEHGRFTSVDELAEVPGIGPSLLADVRDLVRV